MPKHPVVDMSNERLRSQMAVAGFTAEALARELDVDPKTVERWISQERLPHRRHRLSTAQLVGAEEAYLWPSVIDDVRTKSASLAEFVRLYPHRGAVPEDLWDSLIDNAHDCIDVLVYAGLFLVDSHPDLAEALGEKARAGTRVRMLFGDPDSTIVEQRGQEEGIGEGLAARIRLSLKALESLIGAPGVELRQHTTPLYASLYRFDETVLVNIHVYGSPAPQNPVMQLQRVPGGRLFDHFMRAFDRVWDGAQPVSAAGSA